MTNSGVLFSNVTIILKINSTQKYPNNAFFVPNLGIFILGRNIANRINLRALISNMTILFSIPVRKHPHQALLVPKLKTFNFAPTFAIRQIQETDFKYHNSFSKLLPKHPKKPFMVSHLRKKFFLHKTLQLDKFEGFDFKYD